MDQVIILIRFVIAVLIQVLVCKQIVLFTDDFIHGTVMFYPIFIMLLPLRYSKSVILLLSFLVGISVDIFYDSLGVHAGASVVTAFVRPLILKILEPDSGYSINAIPSKYYFGIIWFMQYAAFLLGIHLLVYFSLEAFSFVFWKEIILKTIVTFGLSYIILVIHQMLINSR